MNINKKIHRNIKKKMADSDVKMKVLCEALGIGQSTMCDRLKRLKNGKGVSTSTVEKIAVALNIKPQELLS